MKLAEMSNDELKEEFITYDELINKVGCYGTSDLRWYEAVRQEIGKRGGTIEQTAQVGFNNE